MKKLISVVGLAIFVFSLSLYSVVTPEANASEQRPRLIITEFTTDPSPVVPGEKFNLNLEISNVGAWRAEAVKMTLDLIDGLNQEQVSSPGMLQEEGNTNSSPGAQTEAVFAPVKTGNVMYIDRINANKEGESSIELIVPSGTKPGVYKLVIHLDYINHSGTAYSSSEVIGITVYPKSNIKLSGLTHPDQVKLGEEFSVETEIVNAGLNEIRGVTISLSGMETENKELFLGTFESEDTDNFDATAVITDLKAEPKIILSFLDNVQKEHRIEYALNIQVKKQEELPAQEKASKSNEGGFIAGVKKFFLALFGLGG